MKHHAKRTRKGRGFDVQVCGRLIEPEYKAKIEALARRIALRLMGARLCNTLTLKISIVHERPNYAGAVWTPTHQTTANLRAFAITLDRSRSLGETIDTLAHELQHVEQFRRGRYQLRKWASDGKVHARWEGAEMGPVDSIPYAIRPWEIEAFATGRRITAEFIKLI
jgi:hypothetical protein